MRRAALILALVASGSGWTAPVRAKPGDKPWATCVWQTAPASAARWLTMTPPDWQAPIESPASLLGLRLSALCGTAPAVELKPNRYYNFKQLAGALKAARPTSSAAADAETARVELCRSRIKTDGGETPFRYDVVRVDGVTRTTTFQQFYDQIEGKPLRLPQDLRIVPKADQTVTTVCSAITSDGMLADA